MTTHTPGPWLIDGPKPWTDENSTFDFTEIVCGSSGHPRAGMALAYVWDEVTPRWGDEDKHNAQLIAASPVMLAALKTARDMLDILMAPGDMPSVEYQEIDDAIRLAEGDR